MFKPWITLKALYDQLQYAEIKHLVDENSPEGQYQLGLLYEQSQLGEEPDLLEAFFWYQCAAKSGHPDAKKRMAFLKSNLLPKKNNRYLM